MVPAASLDLPHRAFDGLARIAPELQVPGTINIKAAITTYFAVKRLDIEDLYVEMPTSSSIKMRMTIIISIMI